MFAKIGIALFDPLLTLALWLMVTRVLLQLSHADFYNPISQGIVRLTDAVLRPLRAVLPNASEVGMSHAERQLLAEWLDRLGSRDR